MFVSCLYSRDSYVLEVPASSDSRCARFRDDYVDDDVVMMMFDVMMYVEEKKNDRKLKARIDGKIATAKWFDSTLYAEGFLWECMECILRTVRASRG